MVAKNEKSLYNEKRWRFLPPRQNFENKGFTMKNYLKRGLSLFLCLTLVLAFSACSKAAKLTEDNIIKTAQLVEKAFREFDSKTLQKYINSKTLNYIIQYSENKDQIKQLGLAMFENVTFGVKSVDLKNSKVTLSVNNKDMKLIGERYVKMLNHLYKSPVEMIKALSDDVFLDRSLRSLKAQISRATVPDNPTEVTVSVTPQKDGVVFNLTTEAEDAVSGGALTAITGAFNPAAATTQSTTAKKEN
jgi:hypothetical protein